MSPPEAILTELVIVTLLASIAKSHHALAVAVGTLDRVEDYRGERCKNKTKETISPALKLKPLTGLEPFLCKW